MKTFLLFFLIIFSPFLHAQNITNLNFNNTCVNAFLLNDSSITINVSETKGNIWLKFKAEVSPLNLEILNGKNQTCNYLVFEDTDSNFCDQISKKKLTPLRNNIVNHNIEIDSPYEFLSEELINDGINNLPENQFNTPMKVDVGKYYYVVIYDTIKRIKFNSTNKKEKSASISSLESNDKYAAFKVGDTIIIKCFNNANDETAFNNKSCPELIQLAKFLKKNPDTKIYITSHCDTIMFWKKDPAYQKPIALRDKQRSDLTAEYLKKCGVTNLLYPVDIYIYNYNELNEILPKKGWTEALLKSQSKWQEDLYNDNKKNPRIVLILKSKDAIGYQ